MEHGRTVQDVILFKIKKEVKMKVNGESAFTFYSGPLD